MAQKKAAPKPKSLKEIFSQILNQSMESGALSQTTPDSGEVTLNEAIALSIARMAANGDLKAAAFILNLLEEDEAKPTAADTAPAINVTFDIPRPQQESGKKEQGKDDTHGS